MNRKRLFALLVVAGVALAVVSGLHAQEKKKPQLPDELMKQLNMAMENMAKVMLDMPMQERPKYMMQKQSASLENGKNLFNKPLGRNAQTCNSCHPGGGTTGGEAEIPMKGRFPMNPKLPIPTLVGAAASFPKYKVPNDAVITLGQMGNNCIKMFMMGDGLDLNSQDARDLDAFVSSLSDGEEVAVGKMQMMKK
jgi:thiosulfate dehydrogenase